MPNYEKKILIGSSILLSILILNSILPASFNINLGGKSNPYLEFPVTLIFIYNLLFVFVYPIVFLIKKEKIVGIKIISLCLCIVYWILIVKEAMSY